MLFGKSKRAYGLLVMREQGGKRGARHGGGDVQSCNLKKTRGQIHAADQMGAQRSWGNMPFPNCEHRGANATVIKGGLVPRERSSVVADEQDQCVPRNPLLIDCIEDCSYISIQSGDFIVIKRQIFSDFWKIG